MKKIKTSELIPGMITAEDVFNYTNQLILPKGVILTDKTITKLAFYSRLPSKYQECSGVLKRFLPACLPQYL